MKVSKNMLKYMMKEMQIGESELTRGYGRSTGEALITLGKAIIHPNTTHFFKDHFGTVQSDNIQTWMAVDIAGKLELTDLVFDKIHNSVRSESIIDVNN